MPSDCTTVVIMLQSNSKDHFTGLRKPVWNGHPFSMKESLQRTHAWEEKQPLQTSRRCPMWLWDLGDPHHIQITERSDFTGSLPTTLDCIIPLPSVDLLKPNTHRMVFGAGDFRRLQSHGSDSPQMKEISVPIKGP